MYDTIIIGAGMSGLAAGIRLAHFGRRVCILESHVLPGGLCSFYRRGRRYYDVGLHALTNYCPPSSRCGPLAVVLRQLRLRWEDWSLAPQLSSAIVFPSATLRFSNDFELLLSEVRRFFPRQIDNFCRLAKMLREHRPRGRSEGNLSAREVLSNFIDKPLLREMLLCPVLFYGGAREHDMDYEQFAMLFRAIFLEGLARPPGGARQIVFSLLRRFRQSGGELRLRTPVVRLVVKNDTVVKVVLQSGEELAADTFLSSAGRWETWRLCDGGWTEENTSSARRLSLMETCLVLDRPPKLLGISESIIFYNDSENFHYCRPNGPVDLRAGVVCAPSNFAYSLPPEDNLLRITALANPGYWASLSQTEYRREKEAWRERLTAAARRFLPDFRAAVREHHTLTPLTIQRYTGHVEGAMYGAPEKRFDGTTGLKNLFLCGNDQGLVGVIGALLSGISMTNRWLLK